LQAEQGAPVVHQVEFHVAAPAVELEVPLPLAVGRLGPGLQDGHVGGQVVVAHAFRQVEAVLEGIGVKRRCLPLSPDPSPACGGGEGGQVVEEDAADAPGFVAVLEEEVLVAPALEAGVVVGAEGVQGLAA